MWTGFCMQVLGLLKYTNVSVTSYNNRSIQTLTHIFKMYIHLEQTDISFLNIQVYKKGSVSNFSNEF